MQQQQPLGGRRDVGRNVAGLVRSSMHGQKGGDSDQ